MLNLTTGHFCCSSVFSSVLLSTWHCCYWQCSSTTWGVGEKGKVRALIQAAGQSEAEDSRKNTKHKMKTCQTPTESAAFKISRNK